MGTSISISRRKPVGRKRVEPVKLSFPVSYPLFAPRPSLRDDFDRSHPHLQP
ncbi:MAG: hypothetical protein E8G75_12730, partial [Sulfitobacter sp. SK025]